MKTTTATLDINVNVECPHCENHFDLMNCDLNQLNDEGQVFKELMPDDDHWSDACNNASYENVICPECKNKFNIERVDY